MTSCLGPSQKRQPAKPTAVSNRLQLTLGEPMTIYLSEGAIVQMHRAFGDPLLVYPKARVAGAYFSALIARLIEQDTGR